MNQQWRTDLLNRVGREAYNAMLKNGTLERLERAYEKTHRAHFRTEDPRFFSFPKGLDPYAEINAGIIQQGRERRQRNLQETTELHKRLFSMTERDYYDAIGNPFTDKLPPALETEKRNILQELNRLPSSPMFMNQQQRIAYGKLNTRLQALTMPHVVKDPSDTQAKLGTSTISNYFRSITSEQLTRGNFSSPITVMDIETGHNYKPISVAAVKGVIDQRTGEFRVLDTLERYYTPKNVSSSSFNMAREVHKLTREKIDFLRNQQAVKGLTYSSSFDEQEKQILLDMMKGSTVVGHNITEFDFSKLGITSELQNFKVIDTLTAAEELLPRGHRDLDSVFKAFTGLTMEQAGYEHHFGFADVLANIDAFTGMYFDKSKLGRDIRYIVSHAGVSFGKYEEPWNTHVVKGGYRAGWGIGGQMNYMDEEDIAKASVHEIDSDGNVSLRGGFHYEGLDDPIDVGSTDWKGSKGSGDYWTREMSKLQTILTHADETLQAFTGTKRLQIIGKAAGMTEEGAVDFLKSLYPANEKGEYPTKTFNEILSAASVMRNDRWRQAQRKRIEKEEFREQMEQQRKEDFLNQARHGMHGPLKPEQLLALEELEGSYNDLIIATSELVKQNQELENVYSKISKIKFYDANQYVNSARAQMNGINSAARGVIPSFLLNPVSRLGDAAFNAIDRFMAAPNAIGRIWNSGIGDAVGAAAGFAVGGVPGAMIGKGIAAGASQIIGNVAQAKMERKGYEIQNTLNSLGAITAWISTPFKLLDKAVKTLIGSFSGLTFKINNFMKSGLSEMSGMGNPLTELTGVNYASYQGTTMMDAAALFGKGTMNSIYEDFANQQRALYTIGDLNVNRVIGSSLLGVFGDVYSPTTDTAGAYTGMANSILGRMKGASKDEQARIMYYASLIDKNLPGMLRTANMLGVTDIGVLSNPRNRGMYWNPITEGEERSFRWDQYEFSAMQSQRSTSRMRIADKLWRGIGKDLANSYTSLLDHVASGNWKAVLEDLGKAWDTIKEKVTGVWEAIKGAFGESSDNSLIGDIKGVFKKLSLGIIDTVLEGSKLIIRAWNSITLAIIDRLQGVIAYLSTVQLKPVWKDGGFSFELNTIGSKGHLRDNDSIAGYNGLGQLSYALDPNYMNPEQTRQDLISRLSLQGYGKRITLPEYGIDTTIMSAEQARHLVEYLELADSEGPGFRKAAAAFLAGNDIGLDRAGVYASTTGSIVSDIGRLAGQASDIAINAITGIQGGLHKQVIEIDFKANGKPAGSIVSDGDKAVITGMIRNLTDVMTQGMEFVSAKVVGGN